MKLRWSLLLAWLVLLVPADGSSSASLSTPTTTATPTSARTSSNANNNNHNNNNEVLEGIPRSITTNDDRWIQYPPWNPSRNISDDGFLKESFFRIPGEWEKEVRLRTAHTLEAPCRIRQVPGDGNCLFHSISLCLRHAQNGTHWDMKACLPHLYEHSQELRQQAVACLRDQSKRLVLQGPECVKSRELVEAAAQQYGLTREEYCQDMLQESVWGGGPEIVALANVLKRPIHVYELVVENADADDNNKKMEQQQQFVLRRMACFGSPRFDHGGRREALHILSADSRFPDVMPGKQLSDGNHFLAVFPVTDEDDDDEDGEGGQQEPKLRKRKRLRGGSFWGLVGQEEDEKNAGVEQREEGGHSWIFALRRWWGQRKQ